MLRRYKKNNFEILMLINQHREFLYDARYFLDSRKDWITAGEYLLEAFQWHDSTTGGNKVRAEFFLGPCYKQKLTMSQLKAVESNDVRQLNNGISYKKAKEQDILPSQKLISPYVRMLGYLGILRDRYRKGLKAQENYISELCNDFGMNSNSMARIQVPNQNIEVSSMEPHSLYNGNQGHHNTKLQ